MCITQLVLHVIDHCCTTYVIIQTKYWSYVNTMTQRTINNQCNNNVNICVHTIFVY